METIRKKSRLKKVFKVIGIVLLAFVLIIGGVMGYAIYKIKDIENIKDTHNLQTLTDSICQKYIQDGKSIGLSIGIIQGDKIYASGYGLIDKVKKIDRTR